MYPQKTGLQIHNTSLDSCRDLTSHNWFTEMKTFYQQNLPHTLYYPGAKEPFSCRQLIEWQFQQGIKVLILEWSCLHRETSWHCYLNLNLNRCLTLFKFLVQTWLQTRSNQILYGDILELHLKIFASRAR